MFENICYMQFIAFHIINSEAIVAYAGALGIALLQDRWSRDYRPCQTSCDDQSVVGATRRPFLPNRAFVALIEPIRF